MNEAEKPKPYELRQIHRWRQIIVKGNAVQVEREGGTINAQVIIPGAPVQSFTADLRTMETLISVLQKALAIDNVPGQDLVKREPDPNDDETA